VSVPTYEIAFPSTSCRVHLPEPSLTSTTFSDWTGGYNSRARGYSLKSWARARSHRRSEIGLRHRTQLSTITQRALNAILGQALGSPRVPYLPPGWFRITLSSGSMDFPDVGNRFCARRPSSIHFGIDGLIQAWGTAFFYFTFNDESKQDQSAMLRALLLQLSGQYSDGYPCLTSLHASYCLILSNRFWILPIPTNFSVPEMNRRALAGPTWPLLSTPIIPDGASAERPA